MSNATGTNQHSEYSTIIRPLYLLMQLSIKAYKKYMQNKIYLHALVIRSANSKIYSFLLDNLARIPEPIEEEALQLLNHYDIWMTQFKEFESQHTPALSDSFVFHHLDVQSAFPREAEQTIFNYYHQLKNTIKKSTNE
jgi:hypothetical protein